MSEEYEYEIEFDFQSGVLPTQLREEIDNETGISVTTVGTVVTESDDNGPLFYNGIITMYFNDVLSQAEILLLDAIVAAHIPNSPSTEEPGGGEGESGNDTGIRHYLSVLPDSEVKDFALMFQRFQPEGSVGNGNVVSDTPKETGVAQILSIDASHGIKLSSSANSTNDYYKGWWIKITSGTGVEQTRRLSSYDGTTKVANITTSWITIPDATSNYSLYSNYYANLKYDESDNKFIFGTSSILPSGSLELIDLLDVCVKNLDVSGNITITGTVDGRDVATDGTTLDNHVSSTSNPHSVTIDQLTPTTTKGDLLVENGNNVVRLPVGTNGQVLSSNSSQSTGVEWIDVNNQGITTECTVITDVKTVGTNGGTFTKNVWHTRDLNTIVQSVSGITLSSNRITIPSGTYCIIVYAPAHGVRNHQSRLRNITDDITVVHGTSQMSGMGNGHSNSSSSDEDSGGNGASMIAHTFTITSAKVFEIQHRCTKTRNSDGFGLSAGIPGSEERYTFVSIRKISS